MKSNYIKLLVGSAALVVPQLASASLAVPQYLAAGLASFPEDTLNNTFPSKMTNFSAGASSSYTINEGGSNDGTFGSFDPYGNPSSVAGSPGNVGEHYGTFVNTGFASSYDFVAGDPLSASYRNDGFTSFNSANSTRFSFATSSRYVLGSLLFDASRGLSSVVTFNVAYRTYNVGSPGSSIIPSTVLNTSPLSGSNVGNTGDYADFDLSLGGLVLEAGQAIEFTFANIGSGTTFLDNVALTVIPEPGSLVALGCLVGSGAFLRTRRRSAVTTEA